MSMNRRSFVKLAAAGPFVAAGPVLGVAAGPVLGAELDSYKAPFDSMEPAITTKSDVIGETGYYKKHEPKRWEIVIFRVEDANQPGSAPGRYVKRIVGLPGETIQFTARGLKINGAKVSVPAELKSRFSSFKRFPEYKFGIKPFEIPVDSVFVVGDHTNIYVVDSRQLGAIPIRNLETRIVASALVKSVT